MSTEPKGKVYLVGAGPGDPGLLTRRGEELLRTADVIVYDRLVGEDLFPLIPRETERIDVGKNAGDHPVPQERINEILAEQALAGRQVVRLKGGDPFLFGRGGEELELLIEKGIPFEVVPGITSPIAGAAYGGIPVTHRDFASSVHFITGHARAGKELSIDYEALVRIKGTLVFLMGVSSSGKLAEGLLTAGMDPEMPCAIVENGTRPEQRTFVRPLKELGAAVREEGIRSPALLIIGEVCSLAERFDWYEKLPLKGRSFLVTRPEAGASRLADGLRLMGARVRVRPAIRTEMIRPLQIPEEDHDTVVFTSAVGVQSYCRWLLENGKDSRWFAGRKIAAIGSATAAALREFGLAADFVPSVFSGQVLGREMIATGLVGKDSRVLLLRTDLASRDVTDELDAAGIPYTDIPVYRTEILGAGGEKTQRAGGVEAKAGGTDDYDWITFTSRSCVEGFLAGHKGESFVGRPCLCIGEKTAEAAREASFDVEVSDEATIDSMLKKAVELAGR